MHIKPAKPKQNAYIERFNKLSKNEWLNMFVFNLIAHEQSLVTRRIRLYNN